MKKSWHINRRMVLKSAGVALALPWFESMGAAATKQEPETPKRLCSIMFPYGVAVPADNSPDREWGWFPQGQGSDYQLTNVLKPLAPLMEETSIFGGLSHPNCRTMNGHDTGDTFLTGNHLAHVTYRNTVSLDQYAAQTMGQQTRIPSLTLSTDGGVGPRTRSTTLSYTTKGRPIPALSNPKLIFQRLFGQDNANQLDRRRMENSASILDLVLEQSRSLRSNLGVPDRRKLDEYETSVRDVEQRVERSKRWLDKPLPKVNSDELQLDANTDGPKEYIRAVYDLMFLSFQTDLTRLATYQIGSYGPTLARTFPACIGLPGNWHGLAHGAAKKGGAEQMGKFDQFLAENLAYFLTRLKTTEEADGNMLDRTCVLYGSSNSKTHQNKNYPLLLSGGNKLGLNHNHYLKFNDSTPMSNLFVSILNALDVPCDQFADSTGALAGL
ncbi:MAG: DUF1552 domain-containing protein [Pirellulales bacterium]